MTDRQVLLTAGGIICALVGLVAMSTPLRGPGTVLVILGVVSALLGFCEAVQEREGHITMNATPTRCGALTTYPIPLPHQKDRVMTLKCEDPEHESLRHKDGMFRWNEGEAAEREAVTSEDERKE